MATPTSFFGLTRSRPLARLLRNLRSVRAERIPFAASQAAQVFRFVFGLIFGRGSLIWVDLPVFGEAGGYARRLARYRGYGRVYGGLLPRDKSRGYMSLAPDGALDWLAAQTTLPTPFRGPFRRHELHELTRITKCQTVATSSDSRRCQTGGQWTDAPYQIMSKISPERFRGR